jgi:hypothetical protein
MNTELMTRNTPLCHVFANWRDDQVPFIFREPIFAFGVGGKVHIRLSH